MWRDVVGGAGELSKLLGYVTLVYSTITLANVPADSAINIGN
jgi:hypothetical protein